MGVMGSAEEEREGVILVGLLHFTSDFFPPFSTFRMYFRIWIRLFTISLQSLLLTRGPLWP